ncbi:hypothetical protein N0V85_009579 [Neurospora sp. IMI 360204]|nr:hypothetical protein N0V85_009579 [Neurospora sp. IMI 360204]
MSSPQDQPMTSVEALSLVLYQPEAFDVVMTDRDEVIPRSEVQVTNPPPWLLTLHEQLEAAHKQVREIALTVGQEHTKDLTALKEQYEILRKNYTTVTHLFDAGLEATQAQVARLEQQVQQASNRFASEVWGAIARYSKEDKERQQAIAHLQEAARQQQKALETLDERNARQQSILGRVETWASTKDSQINNILDKLIDPRQLKDLEEQIATVQQNTQKAIQEAFERSGQKAPDTASILRVLEQRAATRPPSSPSIATRSGNPAPSSSMGNEAIQRAQARRQAQEAAAQYEAMQAGAFGPLNTGAGHQGPPGPPRPPPRTFGHFGEPERDQATEFLNTLGSTLTVNTAPLQLNKPSFYDGKDLSKFRSWWYQIETYINVYRTSFTSDDHRISWVGSYLKDDAQLWHQQRSRTIRRVNLTDSWVKYSEALQDRFKDASEQHRNAKKMMELEYKGDVVQYVTTLLDLNESVRWSGTMFRSHVSRNLPSKIIEMVYQIRGGVPDTDDDFLAAIQEAGRVYENMLQDSGYTGKDAPTSRTEHSKSGQQPRKDSRSPSDRNQSSKQPDRSAKDKKWSSNRDALKGIDQADIDQHKKDQVSCWRCGRDNHFTTECFAKKDTNGKDLPQPKEQRTAAISTKRKNDDREEEGAEDLENEAQFKKAKTNAITRAMQTMDMDQDSDSDF